MRDGGLDSITVGYEKMTDRALATVIGNSGKIIAAITATVAILVTFTDVALSSFGGEKFTTTLAVMLIASYLIYFSLEDAGERLGEQSEEYRNALSIYTLAKSKITPDHLYLMRTFCEKYSHDELEYRRRSLLALFGYSKEDYDRFLAGEGYNKRAVRIFRKVERLRAAPLTPTTLLSYDGSQARCEIENPGRRKIFSSLMRLLPSTFCMIFTASVILTAKSDLTPSVIIEGVLKLSALPVVGFRGYVSGYKYARINATAWLETKTRLINTFIEKQS